VEWRRDMRKGAAILAVGAILVLGGAQRAWAKGIEGSQVEAGIGYYSIKAKAPRGDIKIEDFGVFQFAYKTPLSESFMLGLGYSLYTMTQAGNDMGYGLDVGFDWYPLGTYRREVAGDPGLVWSSTRQWTYFVGARFSQRQYQSIQAGYAGGGGQAGVEYAFGKFVRIQGMMRALQLKGPQSAKISEWNAFLGLIRDL
jgi:hypothetical protein